MTRPKAYDIEDAVFEGTETLVTSTPQSLEVQREWVNKLHQETRKQFTQLPLHPPKVVRYAGEGSRSRRWRSEADLTSWTLLLGETAGKAIICHEYAHLLVSRLYPNVRQHHDSHWRTLYVCCVTILISRHDALVLHTAFDETYV